jgi:phospholipid/cholesterol/gamma-HCH transport system ATP-binding protein
MARQTPSERRCILRFQEVSLEFEAGKPILERVSFQMWSGDTRIILGAAGAGKTVMMKIALGLLRPTSGRVFVFGQDVTDYDERQWYEVRSHVGVLFQEGGLFDSLTIEENVAYPLLNQARFISAGKKPTLDTVRPEVQEALNFVELGHTLTKFPSELSGGMRRRVGIARGSVADPELFLYDSPTAGLDPITANTIIALLVKDRELRNTTAAIVTHRFQDGHLLANFRYNPERERLEKLPADSPLLERTKFMVMQEGRLVFDGTEAELDASRDPYISKFSMHPSTKVS